MFPDSNLPDGAQVARAARTLGGDAEGWVLGFHPVAKMNPFQRLLYSRAHASRFAPVGLYRASEFEALRVAKALGFNTALHLHWTSEVLRGSSDAEAAETALVDYMATLRELHAEGIRIIWTVHNVLPHHCPFPEVESRLRAEIASVADVIHVMARGTQTETASFYELPAEKIIEVPHPSYVGAYPSDIEREAARFELGYEPTDFVAGVVGSIQPYKGLDLFSEAVTRLADSYADLRAVVAGIPGADGQSQDLVGALREDIHLSVISRRLSDLEIATVVSALDVAVLPYRASLNSGAALLALSFGVPIVAPAVGGFRDLLEKGLGIGFEANSVEGLTEALTLARQFVSKFDPAMALAFAEELAPARISELFFTETRERL